MGWQGPQILVEFTSQLVPWSPHAAALGRAPGSLLGLSLHAVSGMRGAGVSPPPTRPGATKIRGVDFGSV